MTIAIMDGLWRRELGDVKATKDEIGTHDVLRFDPSLWS
jgi:hypothetical protein